MKLRIEIDENAEEEVVIRCKSMSAEVCRLRDAVAGASGAGSDMSLYIGEREYFVSRSDILFFETEEGRVAAHTVEKMYFTSAKLYLLEQELPRTFVRVSKSCIVNSAKIEAIDKSLTGSGEVFFTGTHKRAYVSRMYYRELLRIINETRFVK